MPNPAAVIFGCEGLILSPEEKRFFEKTQPLGFILFARNCESPQQIRALTAALRTCVAHENAPILIDQEGGRVARLKPPHWGSFPPAEHFVKWQTHDASTAARACYLNARMIAAELIDLGINVDCAPVADLRLEGAHDIIGDRAFGASAEEIVPLARAQAQGLMDGGVCPVLKHIPGHGRAAVDSHLALPEVTASRAELEADFAPFRALADLPMGMTAHIRYLALDKDLPATLSKTVITMIREEIGFDGLLMSDDISMQALQGDLGTLTRQILEAGCDVVLHCNGKMDEMQMISAACAPIDEAGMRRYRTAMASLSAIPAPTEKNAIASEYAALIANSHAA